MELFSLETLLGVELLNMRLRKVSKPVALHQTYVRAPPGASPDGSFALAAEGRANETSR